MSLEMVSAVAYIRNCNANELAMLVETLQIPSFTEFTDIPLASCRLILQ